MPTSYTTKVFNVPAGDFSFAVATRGKVCRDPGSLRKNGFLEIACRKAGNPVMCMLPMRFDTFEHVLKTTLPSTNQEGNDLVYQEARSLIISRPTWQEHKEHVLAGASRDYRCLDDAVACIDGKSMELEFLAISVPLGGPGKRIMLDSIQRYRSIIRKNQLLIHLDFVGV